MSGITSEEIPKLCRRLEKAVEIAKKRKSIKAENFAEVELNNWIKERPYLTLSFVPGVEENAIDDEDQTKDDRLIDLLLSCFLSGQSTHLLNNGDLFDTGFSSRFLPLINSHSVLASFVEEQYFISQGRVNGALAAGIDCILHDYQNFVVTLEKVHRRKQLSLYDLLYQVQDVTETLKILTNLAKILTENDSKGASTLSLMHKFNSNMTVPNFEKKICTELLNEAAAPYMESVQKWVFNGEIDDPFDEFMVIEHFTLSSTNDWKKMEEYWENKYQIRSFCVPSFLEKLAKKILDSGKYLNVIKECVSSERDFQLAPIEELNYDESESYVNVIDRAYRYSSKLLLEYILNEHKIKDRIVSLKKYFLLEQGDFVVQLLDTCHDELSKETSEILPSRLTTLVEMALRISSEVEDPYRDDITISLHKHTLSEQVSIIFGESKDSSSNENSVSIIRFDTTGYESFALSLNCEWPTSLVLHSKIISSYQMLFRHLFYCKYVERALSNVWRLNQQLRSLPLSEARKYTSTTALGYKMMVLLQNVEYYMMEIAIESHWMDFMENLQNIRNVDELLSEHWKFLDSSMKDCLLEKNESFKIFREILADILEFGKFACALQLSGDTTPYPAFEERIIQLEKQFEGSVDRFYKALQEVTIYDTSCKIVDLMFIIKHSFNKKE